MNFRLKLWTVMVYAWPVVRRRGFIVGFPFAGHGKKDQVPAKARRKDSVGPSPSSELWFGNAPRESEPRLIERDPLVGSAYSVINRSKKSQNLIFDTGVNTISPAGPNGKSWCMVRRPTANRTQLRDHHPSERSESSAISRPEICRRKVLRVEAMILGYESADNGKLGTESISYALPKTSLGDTPLILASMLSNQEWQILADQLKFVS